MGRSNTIKDGFKLDDVKAGRYGRHLNFWDWADRRLIQSIDLGDAGLIPLEVRFHHDPASVHGFVGAALSSAIWHWYQDGKTWKADKVIQVAAVEHKGWPFPVPGLITDLVLSLDDRWLYFSDWLHGDIRRYDVSDPAHPKLAAQVWCGGVLGKKAAVKGRPLNGGPQMLQISLDGKRLYVTNSLYSTWDNQFYPDIARAGSVLLQLDCAADGGLTINTELPRRFRQGTGRTGAGPRDPLPRRRLHVGHLGLRNGATSRLARPESRSHSPSSTKSTGSSLPIILMTVVPSSPANQLLSKQGVTASGFGAVFFRAHHRRAGKPDQRFILEK